MAVRPHPTKHLRYHKSKGEVWWIIDIGRGKERYRLNFKGSYEDAVEHERIIRLKQLMPDQVTSLVPKIKELVVPWLAWYANEVSPNTLRDVRSSVNRYFVPYWGNLKPNQLTTANFNNFKSDLLEKGLSPTTINKNLNYFSSLINWAVDNQHCLPLPFKIPKFPKKRTTAKPQRPLTQGQLDAVYLAIEPEYRLLFLLMGDLGLRRDEAMAVRVMDVDLKNKTVLVLGKGNKYRYVPFMTDRFETVLNTTLQHVDNSQKYLVINPATKKPYTTIRKALLRAAKNAGIGRQINHHLLRHTMATLAAENGINPHALQRILGHSSITTTNKIYTNVGQDFVGDEARKLRNRKADVDTSFKLQVINGGKTKRKNSV